MTITHDALDLRCTYPQLVISGGHHWRHGYLPPLHHTHMGQGYLAHTVGKRLVRILLKCILVGIYNLDLEYRIWLQIRFWSVDGHRSHTVL